MGERGREIEGERRREKERKEEQWAGGEEKGERVHWLKV